jgi:serine/threonine-protein kinase
MLESLGKYRIDAMLGRGSMGVVYMAFDPHIERIVALKTIRKDLLTQDGGLVARFKNEAMAAGRLNHPNIVAVYEYGESDDTAYIAMEFVQSTPLGAMLAGAPLQPRATVMSWMAQLLKALEYAHGKGVVHRDIKPDNLLVDRDGQLKITDFGIARIESSTLTQVGMMVGTPCYMSPEQFRGERADRRSDVFAVGVLLFQLLTGVRPFIGSSFEIMHQITSGKPKIPSEQYPPLGTIYDAVVQKAMARESGERYESAQAFLDALHAAYALDGGRMAGPAIERTIAPRADTLPGTLRTMAATDTLPGTLRGGGTGTAPQPGMTRSGAIEPGDSKSGSGTSAARLYADEPWKRDVVPELESILTTHVGPMARLFLKKSAAQANDLDTLCDSLLQHIPGEKARAEFNENVTKLKKKWQASDSSINSATRSGAASGSGSGASGSGGIGGAGAVSSSASRMASGPVLDSASLAACEQRLTGFIGPIAKIVCKRAAAKTQQLHEFYRLVAQNIENEAERTRFLRECGLS